LENNGGYRIAFWVVTVICSVWLVALTTNVINTYNRLEDRNSSTLARVNELHETANESLHCIDMRLTRIEEKLGVK
jgi:hypothetical protein